MPPLAHVRGLGRMKLRTLREPIVALVDVGRHIHAVDDESIDLRIDGDIDQSGVRNHEPPSGRRPGTSPPQVNAPKHGVAQILKFEVLGHPPHHGVPRRRMSVPESPPAGPACLPIPGTGWSPQRPQPPAVGPPWGAVGSPAASDTDPEVTSTGYTLFSVMRIDVVASVGARQAEGLSVGQERHPRTA